MPDRCPEPRSTGDLYLYDAPMGPVPVVATRDNNKWLLTIVSNDRRRNGIWNGFHDWRNRLTLLARREDVGAIVLAAMRWADVASEDGTPECEALEAAVRAAKENAR